MLVAFVIAMAGLVILLVMEKGFSRQSQPKPNNELTTLSVASRTITKRIVSITPNESGELIIQFPDNEYRLLCLSIPRKAFGWQALAHPGNAKRFTFTPEKVSLEFGGELDADYLFLNSKRIEPELLARQWLGLCRRNQAPTDRHPTHHVFSVSIAPFSEKLFAISQSIGGGIADTGGGQSYTLEELLTWQNWKIHFELSGCSWAIPVIENSQDKKNMINTLITEACKRKGM
ncbi:MULTISPECIES: hypothetical protein [unclassified Pseudoalteromonas]|uniref:hypothetical protein n=1 Tax=unclassified Pseudoalteromonas TaxID=194690 RepID=UPI0020975189|nr:hypothetical protein [Pseudoalteromonas sp. XMcav2-N]MCO7187805.1 hypothetical protein [Pseudoalteromonas sp. XMcav2-N]